MHFNYGGTRFEAQLKANGHESYVRANEKRVFATPNRTRS